MRQLLQNLYRWDLLYLVEEKMFLFKLGQAESTICVLNLAIKTWKFF